MRIFFKKIFTTFFLSVILTSNIVGLHFYIVDHHTECHKQITSCQDDNDNHSPEDEPCNICILAFKLSNLNYHTPFTTYFEVNTTAIILAKSEISSTTNLFYEHYFFKSNRNKAPPTLT